MPIAFDAASNAGAFAIQSSVTFAHTVTGSNTILLVGASTGASGTQPTATYNGVSMTFIDGNVQGAQGGWDLMFYLLNPTTGTNNVVVTFNGNSMCTAGAISLTGVKQSGQPDASGKQDAGGNPSKTVTSVADNSWFVDMAGCNFFSAGQAFSSPTPGTQRVNVHNDVIGFGNALAMQTYGPVTPAGATALGWTQAQAGDEHIYVVASFSPAAPPTKILSANGIPQASISSANEISLASISSITGVPNA